MAWKYDMLMPIPKGIWKASLPEACFASLLLKDT